MNGTRNWCTLVDVHPEEQTAGSVDILRLTLQSELTGDELEHIAQQAGTRTFAMVSGRSTSHSLASELVESNDGHEEIIKVYLKGRSGEKMIHEKNINQLKSEVQYIQEARNCLQRLREDISSKLDRRPGDPVHGQEIQTGLEKPNGLNPSPTALYSSPPEGSEVDTCVNEDVESLRKTVRDLLVKLQEAERRHQSDRVAFEVTLSQYQREAEQNQVALQRAEDRVRQKEADVGELQTRLLGMQEEHQALLVKLREGETALEELQIKSTDCQAEREKVAHLEKEVAGLREKIHHLDDMLKSQQRKVRQMIEQLQNSKAVVQSKDNTIQELKEKIAYLEAENLEMHDRMEHLIEKQVSHGNFSTQTWAKTESPGSMRISKPPSKPMPLIRVVET